VNQARALSAKSHAFWRGPNSHASRKLRAAESAAGDFLQSKK
jgi:hypothetical protein